MKLIRIGLRHNLLYPFMFLLFIVLCRTIEFIIKTIINDNKKYDMIKSIYPILIFIPQFFGGIILILYIYCISKKKSKTKTKFNGLKLIQTKTFINKSDSLKKIFILIILASYFSFLTILLGKHFISFDSFIKKPHTEIDTDAFLERRIRSMQIIITAFLCNLTLRIKIYKHHTFSLIVIFIFLLIILCFEKIYLKTHILMLLIYIFHFIIRAFLDTIEKYLIEFNFIDIYKMLTYEGLFSIIIYIILSFRYILMKDTYKIIYCLIQKMVEGNKKIIILLVLLILFMICSGFRHIYRVNTIKLYTPMTLALFELLLDPIFVGFTLYRDCRKLDCFWLYFVIIFVILMIMSFFSLVYNEFLVLYCYGLEKDTYSEIKMRAIDSILNQVNQEEDDDNTPKNNNSNDNGIEIPQK